MRRPGIIAAGGSINQGCALAQGLVGFWMAPPMRSGGGILTDLTNYNRHGTLTNGPAWVGSPYGPAVDLDGVDDYVDVGGAANLNFANDFTLLGRFYRRTDTGTQVVISQRSGLANWPYALFFNGSAPTTLRLYSNNGSIDFVATGTTWGVGWHSFGVSRRGTEINFVQNGIPYSSNPQTLAVGSQEATPAFRIGSQDFGTGVTHFFSGLMTYTVAYNVGMSVDEMVLFDAIASQNFPALLNRVWTPSVHVAAGGAADGGPLLRSRLLQSNLIGGRLVA